MKPVGLFAYQIENSSKPGDIVLDSFAGSGTTMVAW
ncbi:MAG: DNA methyltransferase [Dialister invisus]